MLRGSTITSSSKTSNTFTYPAHRSCGALPTSWPCACASLCPSITLRLIFCLSEGRGLAVSCLSARSFYLSVNKTRHRARPCFNPLSVSRQPIHQPAVHHVPSIIRPSVSRRTPATRAGDGPDEGWAGERKNRDRNRLLGKVSAVLVVLLPASLVPFSLLSPSP